MTAKDGGQFYTLSGDRMFPDENGGWVLREEYDAFLNEIAALAEENTALWCRLSQSDQRGMEVTQRLHDTQDRHAQWQNHAKELERLLKTAVICHSSYCGCEACEYIKDKG